VVIHAEYRSVIIYVEESPIVLDPVPESLNFGSMSFFYTGTVINCYSINSA
jgi:hypothetical protein